MHPDPATNLPAVDQMDAAAKRSHVLGAPIVLAREVVPMPEWGFDVTVIETTAERRLAMLKSASTGANGIDLARIYPDLVIQTAHVVEADGSEKLLFAPTDRPALLQQPGSLLERLALAASRVNGMSEDAEKVAGND